MMNTNTSPQRTPCPILTVICYILGGAILGFALLGTIGSLLFAGGDPVPVLVTFGIALFVSLLLFGVGQVVRYIAKCAAKP